MYLDLKIVIEWIKRYVLSWKRWKSIQLRSIYKYLEGMCIDTHSIIYKLPREATAIFEKAIVKHQ